MKNQSVISAVAAVGVIGMLPVSVAQAQTQVTSIAASQSWNSSAVAGDPPYWTSTPISPGPSPYNNVQLWGFSTANDALLGLSPTTVVGTPNADGGEARASVTDGNLLAVPSSANSSVFMAAGTGGGVTELVYALSQATQLSSIQVFGGWFDAGRSGVNFNVAFSTDGGITYNNLYDTSGGYYITYGDTGDNQTGGLSSNGTTYNRNIGGAGPITTLVDVTDASGLLGGGAQITDLEFTFGNNPAGHGWGGLEQLVATSVPEPSSYVMLGLGGGLLSLMALRRRTAA